MRLEPEETDPYGGELRVREVGRQLAELAARQHGVIATRQLLAIGLTGRQIGRRALDRRLIRIYRGVYAVGHPDLSQHGIWMAGVLACGEGAALSHLCGAANLELADRFPRLPQVTVPNWTHRRRGILVRCATLAPEEIVEHNRIRTTCVTRTILDVCATTDRYRAERIIAQAEFDGLITPETMASLVERYRGRRGVVVARKIHEARLPSLGVTASRLEDRFLRFLDRHQLPRPELNVPTRIAGRQIRVDCLWREQAVALELDGRAAHVRAAAFESDRLRDRRLTVAGLRPVRVTWRHLDDEDDLARDLRAVLKPEETHRSGG